VNAYNNAFQIDPKPNARFVVFAFAHITTNLALGFGQLNLALEGFSIAINLLTIVDNLAYVNYS